MRGFLEDHVIPHLDDAEVIFRDESSVWTGSEAPPPGFHKMYYFPKGHATCQKVVTSLKDSHGPKTLAWWSNSDTSWLLNTASFTIIEIYETDNNNTLVTSRYYGGVSICFETESFSVVAAPVGMRWHFDVHDGTFLEITFQRLGWETYL